MSTDKSQTKNSRRFWATPATVKSKNINSVRASFTSNIDSLPESYQIESFDKITARHIEMLGGDGKLALDLIRDWVDSPYESILRWAVTISIGRDVDDEIAKVQYRSDEAFEASVAAEYKSVIPAKIMSAFGNMTESQIEYNIRSLTPVDRAEVSKYIGRLLSLKEKRFNHVTSHKRMDKSAKLAATKEYQDTLAAVATLTQAVSYSPESTLMRGVYGYQAKRLLERAKTVKSVPIAFDHATSFTSEMTIATEFALITYASKTEPRDGAVIKVHVPRTSMVASNLVFYALRGEWETVVATHGSLMISSRDIKKV